MTWHFGHVQYSRICGRFKSEMFKMHALLVWKSVLSYFLPEMMTCVMNERENIFSIGIWSIKIQSFYQIFHSLIFFPSSSWCATMLTCAVSCPSLRSVSEPPRSESRPWRCLSRRPKRALCGIARGT